MIDTIPFAHFLGLHQDTIVWIGGAFIFLAFFKLLFHVFKGIRVWTTRGRYS